MFNVMQGMMKCFYMCMKSMKIVLSYVDYYMSPDPHTTNKINRN